MPTKSSIDTSEFKRMIELVDEHDTILVRGNGKPSLQDDVRRIKEFIEEEKESRKFYARLVVGAVLTNMIALLVAAFMWFVKIYPVIERLSRETAWVIR